MKFETPQPINLLICPNCKSTGSIGLKRCPECQGMAMGHFTRGRFLFWSYPLTRFHLLLQHARRIFNKVRLSLCLIFGLAMWLSAILLIWRGHYYLGLSLDFSTWPGFYFKLSSGIKFLFWFGALFWMYFWSRLIREKQIEGEVEHHDYDTEDKPAHSPPAWNTWPEALKIKRRLRHNIADTFTIEAQTVLGEAYRQADKNGYEALLPVHLFYSLLSFNRISNIFIRLGVPTSTIQSKLLPLLQAGGRRDPKDKFSMPLPAPELQQIIFQAYESAYQAHQEYVSVTELLLATVMGVPALQEILYDLDINKQKLINVVEWVRIRERLHRQYINARHRARRRSTKGMDKAMTAVQTPFLNQFSEDITIQAQFGYLDPCVAREKEIEEVFRIVEGGQHNVVLVGDNGTGKRSIIEGVAQKMVQDDVPHRLKDKRLVRLSISSLLAGTTPSGAVERLISIMREISRAGNIILFIHNLHELVGVSTGEGGGALDVADTLAEYLSRGRFLTFATTTTSEYAHLIVNSPLGNVVSKVEVLEMDSNQAIQVLESKVGVAEYKHNVFFSYEAIARAVEWAGKFMHDTYLPGSALELMNEAASFVHNKKGVNSLVTGEDVAVVVAEKTHIPVTAVSSDETDKLLHLEEAMHKRVIGQDEAVDLVANALRRARADIRSINRPIANFLFMGPTGVGKTELAKTIADVYFGGVDQMIRLDMSEYQDKQSIYRLIGMPGEKGSGILTEAVRQKPFALLLLDEMEKADKDILNLFLQVMDDGRLTDSTGRVADFTNVILIATTNAGTAYVQDKLKEGLSSEAIKERLLHGELKQYFRPEFLNRFDGIVLFKSLAREDIIKVAGLMLKQVAKDLDAKGIEFKIEPAALEFLADVGFDPEFGARPMRRAIQERIENQLAELLLSKKIGRKSLVIVGAGGELRVEERV